MLFGTVTTGVRGMTATESAETLSMYQMIVLSTLFALDPAVRVRHADLAATRC